ncbi:MAG: hypothetical protein WB952_07605 [Terriglobales bacterium]
MHNYRARQVDIPGAATDKYSNTWRTLDGYQYLHSTMCYEGSGFAGYVLRFMVRTEFLNQYQIHIVGSAEHREYWIPAEDLHKFNENIVGAIEVISEFRREG